MANLDIFRNERIAIQGDSITTLGWYAPMLASIRASYTSSGTVRIIPPSQAAITSRSASSVSSAAGTANYQPTSLIFPHSGGGVATLLANEAEVINAAPTVLLIEIGTNDQGNMSFQTQLNTLVTDYRAALPTLRIACLSIMTTFTGGEQWNPDSQASWVAQITGWTSAVCTSTGASYFDMRTPQQAYEAINNPSNLVTGPLTSDGVHPTATTGVNFWSSTALGYMTLHDTVS